MYLRSTSPQRSRDERDSAETAAAALAEAPARARGAIFTQPAVAGLLLDLTGYTTDRPLHRMRLLEPGFGAGDFLLPVIDRLLAAWRASGDRTDHPVASLAGCLRAVELHAASFVQTRQAVLARLRQQGLTAEAATILAECWLIEGDFLQVALPQDFDIVLGNPPYLRQERIPPALLAEYRRRYPTIAGRADLYIPFLERGLRLLSEGGQLGFLCPDRWMKNSYGALLRQFVATQFHLKTYVDLVGTAAFQSPVTAYPAITVIARPPTGGAAAAARLTRVARPPDLTRASLTRLAATLTAVALPPGSSPVQEIGGVAAGRAPWILEASDQIALLRRLEADFPALEAAGCSVGIGVATGADRAFIGPYAALDVEPDRKLPLVMRQDLAAGMVQWRGLGVINPFGPAGELVRLDDYPRLRRYLDARRDAIAGRHIARQAPDRWYRTIDRIDPALQVRPKLLIPDIQCEAAIVYEPGGLYPHHNLYVVTSDSWDLQLLGAVLRAGIARLFVAAYATRLRGGALRFQAQYLRRIRLPPWSAVPETSRRALITAVAQHDRAAVSQAVAELYGLSAGEREVLEQVAPDSLPHSQRGPAAPLDGQAPSVLACLAQSER
ncbi:Eco57I restriction-modification methylase domain-containing protein [Roseomonas sp. E05]|uniref:Eco57I restriction-modification methylase domain-containing protein n=1 Tax=Roseomonas sp. E05 TaxID=3046310 RepID=UPI0024BAA7F8|nr:Eco57I restriction-modification methylase domain-containing protein [Roseomonas sp. E05]MDJ0391159.1 Eco57I restriction-modification methylase domain-containing protein [Roseomonas sp. E05]